MGRRGNEGDTRLTGTESGDVVRDLGAGKLSTFSGLGSLRHLDLQLLSSSQELGGNSKTSTGNLVNVRIGGVAVLKTSKVRVCWTASLLIDIAKILDTDSIFSTLSRVRLSSHTVDSNSKSLVGLTTQGTEGHGTSTETLHDFSSRLDLINRDALTVRFKVKKITNVGQRSGLQTLLEDFVVGSILRFDTVIFSLVAVGSSAHSFVKTNSIVKKFGEIRRVDVVFSLLRHGLVVTIIDELGLLVGSFWPHHGSLLGNVAETDSSNTAGSSLETSVDDLFTKSHGLKDLSSLV
mmetsp:Transcript_31287/g.46942  ORF Transcript_31287/g.46942 Transcript_31287/m.46942 type:complete len:292 (-) Transcript_31287:1487-2362(-)